MTAVTPSALVRVMLVGLVSLTGAVIASGCGSPAPTAPSVPTAPYSQTDLLVGTGATATTGRSVTVNYTGWLYDPAGVDGKGTQFDTSTGRGPFTFVLGLRQVIAGWDQGVPGMRVGGKRRLVIPSGLAYGTTGSGIIPPYATLVFDIDLLAAS